MPYLDPQRSPELVRGAADALMKSWFPDPEVQPVGEDLDNWLEIAVEDAEVVLSWILDNLDEQD